jgi:hypothetical protein
MRSRAFTAHQATGEPSTSDDVSRRQPGWRTPLIVNVPSDGFGYLNSRVREANHRSRRIESFA